MEISTRSYWTAGTALTAAAITLSPLIVGPAALQGSALPALPAVSMPQVQLAAVVSPEDIDALVARLNSALASVSSTVTSVVALPGNSLTAALESAVSMNDSLWNGLIESTDNRALTDLLRALRATSSGGLSRLSTTVGDTGDALVLTSGEVTDLLASALTGSLSSALHAVATIVNNPLALSSYTGLLNVPLDVAGLALNNGLALVNSVGKGALSLTSSLVTGVTAQVDNILDGVNAVIGSAKGALPGVALLDGVLTAVQGIVSAPVTAALAGVDGLTGTLSDAARRALGNLTYGASQLVDTWLGDGATGGALQHAINAIGTAPLSVASYTRALGVVVSAGINTANTIVSTGTGLLSIPFTAGADLTSTASAMITKFNDGVATAASGILHAAGLPSFVSALPHTIAATINLAVRAVGFAVATGFNAVAAVLDIGSVTSATSIAALPRQASVKVLLSTSTPSLMEVSSDPTAVSAASRSAAGNHDGAQATSPGDAAEDAGPGSDLAAAIKSPTDAGPEAEQSVGSAEAEVASTEATTEVPPSELELETAEDAAAGAASVETVTAADQADGASSEDAATDAQGSVEGGQAESATAVAAHDTVRPGTEPAGSSGGAGRHTAQSAQEESSIDADGARSESHGRHALSETARESTSTSDGRHRSGSAPSADSKSPSSETRGAKASEGGGDRAAA